MRLAVVASTIALFAITSPALASSSYEVQLIARVEPFCRINLPSEHPINLVGGSAQIGVVHEICNTANGYDVLARFTNLSGGALNVGGRNYSIDSAGNSLRSSDNPAIQNLSWQIADATVVQPAVPVIMRVTISPH
jgi:hypothetical protein